MRMRVTLSPRGVHVYLSRRNLLSLLAKLDGAPWGSNCTIFSDDDTDGLRLMVTAEEDDVHYRNRPFGPGIMHPDTEERLTKNDQI